MHAGCDIHEWIYDRLRLNVKVETAVQIDRHKRRVYINFRGKGTRSTLRSLRGRRCNLIDEAVKCRAVFLTRFRDQRDRRGSLNVEWQNVWAVLSPRKTPAYAGNPSALRIPTHLFSRMGVYATPETGPKQGVV